MSLCHYSTVDIVDVVNIQSFRASDRVAFTVGYFVLHAGETPLLKAFRKLVIE